MALIKCHECGNEVSTESKTCQKCGAKVKKPPKKAGVLGWLIAALFGAAIFSGVFQSEQQKHAEAEKSPEQKAAEEKVKKISIQRDTIVLAAMSTIKQNLRNPTSVQWGDVLANDDGSVVCIDYRAQNGFGGMNHESISYINSAPHQDAGSWNKHCAGKKLNDLKDRSVKMLERMS